MQIKHVIAFHHTLKVKTFFCLFFSAVKRKRAALLTPIIPLSFILAFQMDSAYGTLIYRMRGKTRFSLPVGISRIAAMMTNDQCHCTFRGG